VGAEREPGKQTINWSDEGLELRIEVDEAGRALMTRLRAPSAAGAELGGEPPGADPTRIALPLLDVVLAAEGTAWSGSRYCESVAGPRFRCVGHEGVPADGRWRELRVDLDDPVTGLRAEVFYRVLAGSGALRAWVRLVNGGSRPVTVQSVTSFLCGGLAGPAHGPDDLADLDVQWAENDWLAEGRWQLRRVRDALPDLNRWVHGANPRGRFGLTSTGTWSSGTCLPMGAVVNRLTGHAWAWQIEHNGGWHWQVGECTQGPRAGSGDPASGAYVALLGPTDIEHHWRLDLEPGDSFVTVPVAVAVSSAGFEGAVASLTAVRRAGRRDHDDHRRLPVIFNDYMNTLMGDPTTERLLPLIESAAAAGAEYFCIDAGWYAELGERWWDMVGAWRPSRTRFPSGIGEVLDRIRDAGMVPGLWLEPEVVGTRSPIAQRLPAEAFFRRDGRPVAENGRYQLDLRHPASIRQLDEVVDLVVGELGAGYLKLDYNINIAPGPDTGGLSPGAGLLAANRAYVAWIDAVLDRHPGLVIENCASGGMRTDYALLARLQLQSTSDQQDFLRYPPIAAAAPAAIAPEQAAVWAYPQPSFTDDQIAFTLCGALLGRVHLSGHLDRMTPDQLELVATGVGVYKAIRANLAVSVPFWPLGLPRWTDSWIALGMRGPEVAYVTVWHRGSLGAGGDDSAEMALPIPRLRGRPVSARVLYPFGAGGTVSWDRDGGILHVTLPNAPSACVVELAP
jgi:alpha-galactosidase